jgi:hypothetical protein
VVVTESKEVEQAAEELYGLPPGEFTRARDARVKKVRKDGDREAAAAIKALRKPTVAAWALNQLARRRSKDLDALLSAGEELRAAQEELLGGGDRSAFQEAAAQERELVARLSADATALASEAGERAGGLQEKVAETLHAAALDEETADELRAGRLVREREAIGGFGAADSAPAPSSTKRPAKARAKKPPARSKSKTTSTREEASNRQRLAAAKTDERHARRELDAAARAVEHAGERAEAAEAHAAEAAERARTTTERLKEAKRAETAARKSHTRAARALESAERASARKT